MKSTVLGSVRINNRYDWSEDVIEKKARILSSFDILKDSNSKWFPLNEGKLESRMFTIEEGASYCVSIWGGARSMSSGDMASIVDEWIIAARESILEFAYIANVSIYVSVDGGPDYVYHMPTKISGLRSAPTWSCVRESSFDWEL